MAKLVALLFAGVGLGAHGLRRTVERNRDARTTKFIAGIPVLNYDLAYGQQPGSMVQQDKTKEHWVVFAKKGTSEEQLAEFCSRSKDGCEQMGRPSQGGIPFFEIHGSEQELEDVLNIAADAVSFIEPDTVLYAIPELDATTSVSSWGLDRVGAATRARTGKGTHVYVLDTGLRETHSDFGGRADRTMDLTESGFPEDCTAEDPTCGNDANGHGTHCAGSAAGSTYGVAPEAFVHGIKVLGDSGFGSMSWMYSALSYIAGSRGQRPTIASMSLGGTGILTGMETSIDAAVDAGVVVVVAGGNSNSDSCGFTPAFVPSAITVGSTDSEDKRSYFSNFGSCTNIWAPGSAITSASHESDFGSATMSGTSMACPHVAGAAALVLEANPALMPAEVLATMHTSAENGAIANLRSDDTHKSLWVGGGPAPVPAPTPPPPAIEECTLENSVSRWPDNDGDCKCGELNWYTQLYCTLSGPGSGLHDCPNTAQDNHYKFVGLYYFANCTECQCLTSAELKR